MSEVKDLEHEVAILHPRSGDVFILYVDLLSIQDVTGTTKFLRSLRRDGIRVGILPVDALLTSVKTEEETQQRLNDWLRPFGYRAVRE